ncbi:Karyopherin transporter [Elasticomyces elasticus]|nr:Karyopherin transporter [Elasticomyces elasticus]
MDAETDLEIKRLDGVVNAFYTGRGEAQKIANMELNQFREDPNSWVKVDAILQHAQNAQTKYLGLQILDSVIMTRWKVLPEEQRLGIREFVVGFILKLSQDEENLKKERTLLNKLNLVLVSILKQDWPHNWPNFINEIIQASQSSLPVCENNLVILRLLSEEVFDFSSEQMTSTKARQLKNTLNSEFTSIYRLCSWILMRMDQPSLIKTTLETLLRFLSWIPYGYIFDQLQDDEPSLIEILRRRNFLEAPEFRNITLKCLTEISSLESEPRFNEKLIGIFTQTLNTIAVIIPLSLDLKSTYATSNSRDQEFIQNLALFLTTFFSTHLPLIENLQNRDYLNHGHFYLMKISQIDDREIFKICLSYWIKLVDELHAEMQQVPIDVSPLASLGVSGLMNGGATHPNVLANYPLRKHKYNEILLFLRQVIIEKMAKPEEVLIVENDEGEIVREFVKESDTIQLYKDTRECLVLLTHLDVADTEHIMSEKLARQVDGTEWSWANCNTLCWAIGSISGAMNEETEKRFLVTVIKDLLGLTEMKRGKDNKAVVASNIMYIVGQYPRFLKAHWKFLKTVVNKLFEFMHETHEGVQDMACDTFIKIANKCRRHFVLTQPGETEPFIDEIVRTMRKITCDLSPLQVHTFYEACGYMISAQGQKAAQDRLITQLMEAPNEAIISMANNDPQILQESDTIKVIGNIMKTNVSACTSIGTYFYPQIQRIYKDMLLMYRASSEIATKYPQVRGLRTIKKEILKLVNTYVEKAADLEMINDTLVPDLLGAVLVDYRDNVPDAREAEVLNVMSTLINKLQGMMTSKVIAILDHVFMSTLDMIKSDFSNYPEHRVEFFKLLRVINLKCFPALLELQGDGFKSVVDSCMWASKHDNRVVEGEGLNMLLELMSNIAESNPNTCNAFFQQFFFSIMEDVLFVLTDSDHKAGFKYQVMLLSRMFWLAQSNKITVPLYTPDQAPIGTTNKDYLAQYVQKTLETAFPNLSSAQVSSFIQRLFDKVDDQNQFRITVRDFLIQLKEFAGDNAELFSDEREKEIQDAKLQNLQRGKQIGGLLKPEELGDDDDVI